MADLRWALVVFKCSPEVAESIDVASGPCVSAPSGQTPLVSVHLQSYSENLDHMRALYQVLTDDAPESALLIVAASGRAELALLSDRFVDALLDVRDAYVGNDEQVLDDVARRWLAAAEWSPSMTIGGLVNRLQLRAVIAAGARQSGLPMYCWHGPAQREFVVVSGQGPYRARQRDN